MSDAPSLVVPPSGPVVAHCLRLLPGARLMPSLRQAAMIALGRVPRERSGSAFVITAVGSLRDVTLRLANASRFGGDADGGNDIKRYGGRRFEIVSMTGTFSREDGCHVHVCLADAEGDAVGGHLVDGVVFTTCELVLGTADGVEFSRRMDGETGYKELEVRQMPASTGSSSWRLAWKALLGLAVAGIFASRYRPR